MRRLLIPIVMIMLAACSRQGMMDRLASPGEQHQAIAVADQIRAGRADLLMAQAEPQLAPQLPGFVAQVKPLIAGVPGAFTIHGLNTLRTVGQGVTKRFVLQAGGNGRWAVVTVVLDGTATANRLYAVNVTPATIDPTTINDFHLGSQGALGIVWSAIMLLCLGVSLAGMILPWCGRWLKHRWAWTIGSFFGLFSFALNWSTGQAYFTPLSVIFLGARTMRAGDYAPWYLAFGLPVVAMIVVVRWFRRERGAELSSAPAP